MKQEHDPKVAPKKIMVVKAPPKRIAKSPIPPIVDDESRGRRQRSE